MSRARELSKIGNKSTLAVDTTNTEVGIASTVPSSTLDVRGEVKIGTAIQAGSAGVVTATTFSGAVSGTTGTFSSAVNVDATTDSTSSTSGALIVDGGLGVAKNVYIGAGLSVAGTLTYEDVTNVDAVGLITAKSGVNISGGQLQVGVAYSVGSAGVATAAGFVGPLTGAVTGNADTATTATTATNQSGGSVTATTGSFSSNLTVGSGITFGSAGIATFSGTSDIHLLDSVRLKLGDGSDGYIQHSGSALQIIESTGNIKIESSADDVVIQAEDDILIRDNDGSTNMARFINGGAVELYHAGTQRLSTTNSGASVSGGLVVSGMTTSVGVAYTGILRESFAKTGGKLSDNTNIDLEDGMVHYFTTQETTTSTPNLRWNSSFSLTNKMNVNDAITVTIITTAAAGGYSANLTIDGNAVTEQWVGGSAPSEGGSDGYDIYTYNILKIGTGTGDSGFFVIGNLVNAT